jgi:hypothetical protein
MFVVLQKNQRFLLMAGDYSWGGSSSIQSIPSNAILKFKHVLNRMPWNMNHELRPGG